MTGAGPANPNRKRGSGMPAQQPEPRYLVIGRVLRPHGVRGELRLEIITGYPERVAQLKQLFVGPDHRRYAVEGARLHQGALLLKLQGCDDRTAAEALRNCLVEVAREEAVPLAEGEYYHFQLIGVQVITEAGEPLGEIVEVLDTPGANDVYVVQGPRGELLLPGIREVVRTLDLAQRQMVVHLLPGLLETTAEDNQPNGE